MNIRTLTQSDESELTQRLRGAVRCAHDGDECRIWLEDGSCIVFTAYMAMLDVKHYDPEAADRDLNMEG